MKYTRYEQETSISYSEGDRTARIYTASPRDMRKLDKLTTQFPDAYKRVWEEKTGDAITAAKYEVDARFIRFGKPASAAQTAARKANASKMHSPPQKPLVV